MRSPSRTLLFPERLRHGHEIRRRVIVAYGVVDGTEALVHVIVGVLIQADTIAFGARRAIFVDRRIDDAN